MNASGKIHILFHCFKANKYSASKEMGSNMYSVCKMKSLLFYITFQYVKCYNVLPFKLQYVSYHKNVLIYTEFRGQNIIVVFILTAKAGHRPENL